MFTYDAPSTFRGQLQRGRGIAVLRAPREPEAADAVYECVIGDSRWDWQVDERVEYLAVLIRQLGLSPEPIERHLAALKAECSEDPAEGDLASRVLAALGVTEPDDVMPALESIDPTAQRRTQLQLRQRLTHADTRRLIELIEAGGADRRRAIEELGRRREDRLVLDLAENPGIRNVFGAIPGMRRALRHLGPAALPRARTWMTGDATVSELAVGVVAEHGDASDTPFLLAALQCAVDDEAWCATEDPARGLGRLHATNALDTLAAAWENTAHSLAREAILEGIQGCAGERAATFTAEGLYDCEPSVQRLADAIK